MSDDSDSFAGLLLGSGAFVFLSWVIDRGIRFGGRLIVARGFGKVDYGVVSLGATVLAMGSTIALFGLHAGVTRYLPRNDSTAFKRGIILSAAQIVLPTALVVGGLVVVFAEPLAIALLKDSSHASLLRAFGFGIPLATAVKFSVSVVQGQQNSKAKVVIQNIAIPLFQFGGIAVAYALTLGPLGVAWTYTISYGVAMLLSVYYLRKHTPLFDKVDAVYHRKELFAFSLPLLFTSMMFMLLADIDIAMLGYFDSSSAIAEYNVAYPISFLLVIILESFGFLFIPILSQLHSNNEVENMESIYQLLTKWVIFLTTPMFLLVVAYPQLIISLTFGEPYTDAALALVILSIGFFTKSITGPNGPTLTTIGKTRLHLIDTATVTMLNIVLNLMLIPQFSYLGAAAATAVSYILLNFLYSYQVYTETGIIPVSSQELRPLIGLTVISTIAYVISPLPSSPWEFGVLFVSYGVAFIVTIVMVGGIGPEEYLLIEGIEERLNVDLTTVKSAIE